MKTNFIISAVMIFSSLGVFAHSLDLDESKFTLDSLAMPDGTTVVFKSYKNMTYVTNPEDPRLQTLNLFVPLNLHKDKVPILLRTYIGGYMETEAMNPAPDDATGRALKEGYVVCIPGSRGANSTISLNGKEKYIGTAPNGLVDLKASIRYLRHNRDKIPGNTDLIFIDGTSAGGAMASLIGTTANNPLFEPYLKSLGAADERDDVFGAICFCPITDLNHADMEYEWLYGCTNNGVRHLDNAQKIISEELSAMCPDYINGLRLYKKDGTLITADNYKEYLKSFLMESAHIALGNGCIIPDTIGVILYNSKPNFLMGNRPLRNNPDMRDAPSFGPAGRQAFHKQTDFVTDIDLDKYLSYVASCQPLKTPPAFDAMGVLQPNPTPENKEFGNVAGEPANFTDFSLQHRLHNPEAEISQDMVLRVKMMNPMDFIGDPSSTSAPHWYIRHGAKDRDTSFLVPINLATKLMNNGLDVNFCLAWNRPHMGDYNLDNLFCWIESVICKSCEP